MIHGPSGSGKTTLLNILALVDSASAGDYDFAGQEIAQLDDRTLTALRREQIGIIFQSFNLVPVLTAIENVALPLEIAGVRSSKARKRAADVLDEVEIAHLGRKPT